LPKNAHPHCHQNGDCVCGGHSYRRSVWHCLYIHCRHYRRHWFRLNKKTGATGGHHLAIRLFIGAGIIEFTIFSSRLRILGLNYLCSGLHPHQFHASLKGWDRDCLIALVLISQVFLEQDLSYAFNALYILLIGIGVAFLLNLYIPKSDKTINKSIKEIDDNIDKLIQDIAQGEPVDFTHVKQLIKQAKEKLFIDLENHYYVQTNQREDYIKMRRGQLIVLERIAPILEAVAPIREKQIIIDFLNKFEGQIGITNKAKELREELQKLLQYFKDSPLPKTRDEFEHRAELYHVLLQLDEFLDLKMKYHDLY